MTQQRLNNLMVLHVHKNLTDNLDLKAVTIEFIGNSEHRLKIFVHLIENKLKNCIFYKSLIK